MPDDTVTPPPKETPVHVPDDLAAAKAALEDADAEDARITFSGGLSVSPLELTGLDEYRIRVATNGHFSTLGDVFEAMSNMSLEAAGALYYVARLNADGLKPGQADYTYEDCLASVSMQTLSESVSGGDDGPPS